MDSLLKDLFGIDEDEVKAAPAAAPEAPAAATAAAPAAQAALTDREAALKAQREARRDARKKKKADAKSAETRKDFVERYSTGAPSEGFTAEEAIEHLAELREELGPTEFQAAMVQTLDNLPVDQRDEFIALMRKHREVAKEAAAAGAAPAAAAAAAGAGKAAPAADPFGGLLTGLIGGRSGAAAGGGMAGMNVNDVFSDLRSGGLNAPASGSGGQPTADDFMALLNSPLGKAVLGGLAAYGMQAAQKDDDDDAPARRG